jgi:hypothetical protein
MSWQPGRPTVGGNRPDPAALEQRVVQLEQQLAALMKCIKVEADGASVTITSAGMMTLRAAAVVELSGALIKLNNGHKPIIRVGDPIVNGVLVTGNPTVMA